MDDSKKISIRINGEDTELGQEGKDEKQQAFQVASEEQASAVEDWIKEKEKAEEENKYYKTSKRNRPSFSKVKSALRRQRKEVRLTAGMKRMFLASISAVLVGVFLGLLMIRIFAGGDGQQMVGEDQGVVIPADSEDQASEAIKQAYSFPAVNLLVVQAGVFSTKDKAENWQQDMDEQGIETYIWPRDEQYYLLAGVASSENQASNIVDEIQNQGFDAFVKEWSVQGGEKQVEKKEGDWVAAGMDHWSMLVEEANEMDESVMGEMTTWIESRPSEVTESTSFLIANMEKLLNAAQAGGQEEIQQHLLHVWHSYEQFMQ
ncbi:SPOR domain-containing protein [Pontibacillus litoralis]|uniref:SPOR domain-containing protein n=1 Tax=Pontibacillus litoralis JSM 072002 TaxID=1385512 RepID=A0A0A5I019_9BACI|nr:SPOR domain-containing protein [Pontibacillus litoralis]KGX89202.1 hypothetical protein N784_01410 [Pontibacillus litoralis JSM 072002]